MERRLIELFAILLMGVSLTTMFLYLNYLNIGYSFFDYVKFISRYIILLASGVLIIYLLNRRK